MHVGSLHAADDHDQIDTAEREIETLSVEEALALFGRDDVTFVDSPYHNRFLRKTSAIFSCPGGLRSALATQTPQCMGPRPVAHIRGGFGAWRNANGPLEPPSAKPN